MCNCKSTACAIQTYIQAWLFQVFQNSFSSEVGYVCLKFAEFLTASQNILWGLRPNWPSLLFWITSKQVFANSKQVAKYYYMHRFFVVANFTSNAATSKLVWNYQFKSLPKHTFCSFGTVFLYTRKLVSKREYKKALGILNLYLRQMNAADKDLIFRTADSERKKQFFRLLCKHESVAGIYFR